MYKTKIFYKSMIIVFFITIGYFISVNIFAIPKIENSIYSLEERNAKTILNEIVSISHNVYKDIKHFPIVAIDIQKKNLKNLNYIAYSILETNYLKYKNKQLTQNEAKEKAYEEISNLRYGDNGYFFILGDDYKIVIHPDKKIQGKDYSKVKDVKGKFFVKEMVDIARQNKESAVRYWWGKITGEPFEKMSYTKKFEPWNIYVGTGIYIDDINKKIEARKKELYDYLHEKISNTKISNSGYIYVFDSNANMIMHPDKNLVGANLKKLKNPSKGTLLFDDMLEAYSKDKKIHYLWNKLSDKDNYTYEKVSWIEYVKELDWYIIVTVYVKDFEKSSEELKYSLMVIGMVLLLISVLIASIFFRKLAMKIDSKTEELICTQNKLKDMANKDMLTGLYNRRYLYDIVPKILSYAKRENKPLSLLMIDLDKFKHINDTYGHTAGDTVLEFFADILREHFRESDIIARVGGEEFLVLLNNTNHSSAFDVADKFREFTKKQNIELGDGVSINITLCIGISSIYLDSEVDIDKAIARADKALYDAKHHGRDKVCCL